MYAGTMEGQQGGQGQLLQSILKWRRQPLASFVLFTGDSGILILSLISRLGALKREFGSYPYSS